MVAAELATLEQGRPRKSKDLKVPNGTFIDDAASLLVYREAMKEQGKRADLCDNVTQVAESSDRGNARAYSLDRECAEELAALEHKPTTQVVGLLDKTRHRRCKQCQIAQVQALIESALAAGIVLKTASQLTNEAEW